MKPNLFFSVKFACFALIVAVPTIAFADPSCFLSTLQKISPSLSNAYENTLGIDPALIRGEKTPAWKDFENLKWILKQIQDGKNSIAANEKRKALKQIITDLEASENLDPKLITLQHASDGVTLSDHYKPTEYELKQEYQNLLWSLNQELPKKLKIPGVKLPVDTRLPGLVDAGKRIVRDQEIRFQKQFRGTGFRSLTEFNAAVAKQSGTAKALLDMFENEDFDVAMNRPENARWWSPRVGFQNQRITGSSRGSFDISHRNDVESSMMGISLADYTPFDDQLKPNYGYLKPKADSGYVQAKEAEHYGSDVYTFKKDKVRDRLTWTAGDSFGSAGYAKAGKDGGPSNWRGNFVPWKYRNLIIPDTLPAIEAQNIAFRASPPILVHKFTHPDPGTFTFAGLEEMPRSPTSPAFDSGPVPVRPALPNPPVPPILPVDPEAKTYAPLIAPKITRLKEGESVDAAMKRLQASKRYKDYLEKRTRQQTELAAQRQKFLTSDAMKNYQAAVQIYQKEVQQKMAEFQQSELFLNYLKRLGDYQAKQLEFQKTPEYLQYAKDTQEYRTKFSEIMFRNQEKQKTALAGPDGLAYAEKKRLYQEEFQAYQQSDEAKWDQYLRQTDPRYTWRNSALHKFKSPNTQGYIELQYWGPVGLDDVEGFEFRGKPPEGEFLTELQRRGIQIRDGRVQPAVEWNP